MKTSVILEKLRSFMRLSQTPVSAHMLVEQISQSLRLQPVVIATQAVAAVAILLYFWSVAFKPVLFVWAAAVDKPLDGALRRKRPFVGRGGLCVSAHGS